MNMAITAILLFVLAACDQLNEHDSRMGLKHTYSLCPIGAESRERLYVSVREFAEREGARLIDRGGEAQRELAGMRTGQAVLRSTGGDLIVLTVEKPGRFRVSVSHLGLIEKVALTIRYWNEAGHDAAVDTLLADIERFWIIQTVEGGVTDDPPCVSPPRLVDCTA